MRQYRNENDVHLVWGESTDHDKVRLFLQEKGGSTFSLQPYYDIKLGSGPFNWLIQSGVEFYPFKSYGAGKFNLYYAVGLNYIFEINSSNEVKKPREIQL